jgi:hypothetical protein
MSNIRLRTQVGLKALVTKCPSNSKLAIYPRNITCKETVDRIKQLYLLSYKNEEIITHKKWLYQEMLLQSHRASQSSVFH